MDAVKASPRRKDILADDVPATWRTSGVELHDETWSMACVLDGCAFSVSTPGVSRPTPSEYGAMCGRLKRGLADHVRVIHEEGRVFA